MVFRTRSFAQYHLGCRVPNGSVLRPSLAPNCLQCLDKTGRQAGVTNGDCHLRATCGSLRCREGRVPKVTRIYNRAGDLNPNYGNHLEPGRANRGV